MTSDSAESPKETGRIHPWECPECGDDGAPFLDEPLAVYRCLKCGFAVPIDEVGN